MDSPPATLVFDDDFEIDKDWTANPVGTDTATAGQWERGDPEATSSSGTKQQGTTVSGVNDLVTGRLAGSSAGTHDVDGGVTSIRSPAIALPSTGTLTLSFNYYLAENGVSRDITSFKPDRRPVSVAVMVDTSAAMGSAYRLNSAPMPASGPKAQRPPRQQSQQTGRRREQRQAAPDRQRPARAGQGQRPAPRPPGFHSADGGEQPSRQEALARGDGGLVDCRAADEPGQRVGEPHDQQGRHQVRPAERRKEPLPQPEHQQHQAGHGGAKEGERDHLVPRSPAPCPSSTSCS